MQMYSKLFRQAYGRLACLAILAAIAGVLAACGAGPGAKAQPDPVKIKDVVFEKIRADDVKITLGDKFSGSELTYTATSNDKAVATVAIDNDDDILTVTANGAGEATITVTAADSQDRTASQTFKVTVKATTSEPEPGAPTVRTGAPGSFDVDQGDTQTVTLSRVFTGEDLEFTVASNDTDVATASEDAGILTITARSPGDATITVTATNDDGNAAHRITVTVPLPVTAIPEPTSANNPSNCQSPLTIKLNEIAKCKLPSKATLKAAPPPSGDGEVAGVEVRESTDDDEADVWIIGARKKGTYTVTIFSGSASPERIGEITVVVPNSPPVRNTKVAPASTTITISGEPATGATYSAALANGDGLSTYFTDADGGDEDRFRYIIGKKPVWLLIDAQDGFVVTSNDANTLTFEVLEKVTENFQVTIYANDESERSLQSVVLTFPAGTGLTPRVRDYEVTQGSNGDLNKDGALKVGPRLGVPHEVMFTRSLDGPGFRFANRLIETWEDSLDNDVTAGSAMDSSAITDSHDDIGKGFFAIKATDGIVAEWADTPDLAGDPKVTLTLEKARSGSITIEYTLWVASKKKVAGSVDVPEDATPVKKSTSKRLSVTVVTCSSPPDPLTACPGN